MIKGFDTLLKIGQIGLVIGQIGLYSPIQSPIRFRSDSDLFVLNYYREFKKVRQLSDGYAIALIVLLSEKCDRTDCTDGTIGNAQ